MTWDNNTFDNTWEPVHFGPGTGSNYSISNNVITNTTRYAIEIQNRVYGIKINNNYVRDYYQNIDHQGLSVALNPGSTGAEVGGNILIRSGNPLDRTFTCAIEAAGSDFNLHDNYCWNWFWGCLNGSQGSFTTNNNTWVQCDIEYAPDGGLSWSPASPQPQNDHYYPPGAPGAPAGRPLRRQRPRAGRAPRRHSLRPRRLRRTPTG